ncbi:hypothetical protein [Roseinatronobacter alkalisoli]|uniref:DUF2059 domain-containing protein n=1 Tax=Roseinatronobacter alkalisoli TaxID=3028235 RepID=A0ABT5T763_9RHOB|nr:hypothetical protein [Roseinatronobacter sp. HJB301]MDD7970231.1 hypothetical protein [Roseinatronobacter sp. HJB301]
MATKAKEACGIALLCVLMLVSSVRLAQAQDLSEAFLLPELFQIMAAEGRAAIGQDSAAPVSDAELDLWRAELDEIYDADRMHVDFVAALDAALESKPGIRADAIDFATTELGQRILRLEISARDALLQDEIDDVARLALLEARSASQKGADNRLALVRARIRANDLVELNVSLGMNTSYAYYRGMLAENTAIGLNAEDMLNMVQALEPSIRNDVTDWIESYFLMAYQPLSDDELQAYIAYSASPEGDAFNRAMFQAFDAVFVGLSHRVGRALGRIMNSESL